MKRRGMLALVGGALLAGCASARRTGADADAYLFAYFIGNGEDGLHFAASRDGYRWEAVGGGRSFLTPTVGSAKLMRDPCIACGPDGVYHMVWTCGWNGGAIGYASSRDLLHWSKQRALAVMAREPATLNAWAPELVWDAERGEFLVFWASTIPGRFPDTDAAGDPAGAAHYNHRIYATTTRDFTAFTPTRLFYDPGFSVIDATFVRSRLGNYLVVKDETRTPPHKYLQLARTADLHGPFATLSAPISPAGVWAEGPTALQVGADVIVYFDAYTAKHYGALRSRDLVHWDDVTALMRFPDEGTARRMRHGTAIQVPAGLVERLR